MSKTSTTAGTERNGPVFLIDPHEDGIVDLPKFGQCPEASAIHTCTSFTEACQILRSMAATPPNLPKVVLPRLAGVVYGPSGVGKTSFCANFGPDTIVIDSTTGMENLCFHHCCEEDYDSDWSERGFYSYQQGPATAATRYWEPEFIGALNECVLSGYNVLVIAHSTIKRYEDPEGPGYERYVPFLHKQLWQRLHRWSKMVLFYNYYVATEKQGTRIKPDLDTEERQIYTVRTAAYDAKNRYGLPAVIQAGMTGKEAHDNFIADYSKCLGAP